MKKRVLGLTMSALAIATLASCGGKKADDVFHIMAWNEEFKGFFEKYFATAKDGKFFVGDKEVKWTIVPNEDGAYQNALDKALAANATAKKTDKIDMFLAEADYIQKYANSSTTKAIKNIKTSKGYEVDTSLTYEYTRKAVSDAAGNEKGVSFQCCPSAMIYRRSIAKAVLGSDDPDVVQTYVSDWDKYMETAAKAKAKGYYITASFAETYRAFSNNVTSPWVVDGKINIDSQIEAWMNQQEEMISKEYVLKSCPGIWDGGKNDEMFKTGKTMTFFGPAWYYNFCMGNALDETNGTYGDWAICEGPAAHFWGGTWLLAAAGGDDDTLVADTMDAFINSLAVTSSLIEKENQFSNNQAVNSWYANNDHYGNGFLGGQNDSKLFFDMTDNIQWENTTVYDQLMNEKLQDSFGAYLKGKAGIEGVEKITREQAINNFKETMIGLYPELKK